MRETTAERVRRARGLAAALSLDVDEARARRSGGTVYRLVDRSAGPGGVQVAGGADGLSLDELEDELRRRTAPRPEAG